MFPALSRIEITARNVRSKKPEKQQTLALDDWAVVLPVPLPALRRTAPRDQRRAERGRAMERATDFVFFARRGEMVSNRHEDHEISMLALHLIQNCMIYINILMIQKVLAQPHWHGRLTPRDYAALTPLMKIERFLRICILLLGKNKLLRMLAELKVEVIEGHGPHNPTGTLIWRLLTEISQPVRANRFIPSPA
jgi:hypothetical protein